MFYMLLWNCKLNYSVSHFLLEKLISDSILINPLVCLYMVTTSSLKFYYQPSKF